ncbi:VOC family protein [Wenyingzhuangia sp. IMCC45467]
MIFRAARHTNNLEVISNFYVNILNLEILGSFKNHNGYDGVFIGEKECDWHLEFTVSKSKPQNTFDEDDLFVFYPQSKKEYAQILKNIQQNNISLNIAKNPYWAKNGVLIQDPDGYNIIICNLKT